MAKIPSRSELVAVFEAEMRNQLDPGGTGAINLRPGSRSAALVSMATLGAMRLSSYVADRVAAYSLFNALGSDLEDRGRDLFGEERKGAAQSTGALTLTRTATGATFIPKGSRVGTKATATQPAVTFEVSADVTVLAGVLTAPLVPIICQQTGEVGNVDGTLINQILDPLPDATWAITGVATPIGGGADVETDEDYRTRLSQRSLDDDRQRGTRRAINAGAGRVPGVKYWTVVEPGNGSIIVYAGDANYLLSNALRLAILSELENWRPYGPALTVQPYAVYGVTVAGTIYMQRPLKYYDQSKVIADARDAVKRYFDSGRAQPDEYFKDAIAGAIFKTHREIQHVLLTSPAADVLRPADAGYGTTYALRRYTVTDASIALVLSDPLTS